MATIEEKCPQCGGNRDNPREDSIERLLVCGASFHAKLPSPAPEQESAPPEGKPDCNCRNPHFWHPRTASCPDKPQDEPKRPEWRISRDDVDFIKSLIFQGPDMTERQERRARRIIDELRLLTSEANHE